MANTELSPTGSARLPPLVSQFPQWSRTTPLNATLTHHTSTDQINGLLKVSKKCGGGGGGGGGEVVVSRAGVEGLLVPSMAGDPLLHITQLEHNIRWLHEQHQLMLSSLQLEIEALRQRNRDLQFQLVFSKGGITISHSSSDSSPEDKHKVVLSPKECNTRTLQVEMLEKEVSELKGALAEVNGKNAALSATVEHQKKQIMALETRAVEADYETKLDDAERIIRRLRKDNDDQRKEIASLRAAINKNCSGSGRGGGRHSGGRRNGGGGGGGGGGEGGQSHDHHRFPPLHSQSYWHSQQRPSNGPEYQSQPSGVGGPRRSGGGGSAGGEAEEGDQGAQPLPHLGRNYSQPSSSHGNRSRYYSNGNYYYSHRGGNGKYKGGPSKDHREPDQ